MTTLDRLNSAVEHPAPARGAVPGWQLLLAVVLAPIAFSVQVTASYVVASNLCGTAASPHPILLVINVVAVLVTAAGLLLSIRAWRRLRGEKGDRVRGGPPGEAQTTADLGEGRTRFIALCAVCGSVMLGFAVLADAIAMFVVGICAGFAPVG